MRKFRGFCICSQAQICSSQLCTKWLSKSSMPARCHPAGHVHAATIRQTLKMHEAKQQGNKLTPGTWELAAEGSMLHSTSELLSISQTSRSSLLHLRALALLLLTPFVCACNTSCFSLLPAGAEDAPCFLFDGLAFLGLRCMTC